MLYKHTMQDYQKSYAHLLKTISETYAILPHNEEKFFGDLIEYAPSHIQGDLALPCFSFAAVCKKSPVHIAQELADVISEYSKEDATDSYAWIESVEAVGPYCNISLSLSVLVQNLLPLVYDTNKQYGTQYVEDPQTILIESPSPNTNKPLHLGHVRNMLLGTSLVNIRKALGHDAKNVEVINDRGIHICKSMLAYDLYANELEPQKKTDHFVGDWYVRFAQENIDDVLMPQAQEMLQQRESGDKRIRTLWKTMNARASQ